MVMNEPVANQQMSTCPSCGHQNPVEVWFCQNCGSPCKTYANESTDSPMSGKPAVSSVPEPTEAKKAPPQSQETPVCPRCGQSYRPGEILCSNCGINLSSGELRPLGTQKVNTEDLKTFLEKIATGRVKRAPIDTNPLPESSEPMVPNDKTVMQLCLHIEGHDAPITINIEPDREYVLGRRDETNSLVDIDLTPYNGYHKGVSRRQAVLELRGGQVELRDLGSRNGTFLNGERLAPSEPQQLRNRDKIALSKLVFRVTFS